MGVHRLSLSPPGPFYPTASELRIASECVAPWALGLEEMRETSEWAEFGRYQHELAEDLANCSQHVPHVGLYDSDIARLLDDAIAEDRRAAKGGVWHVEQGIKWRSDGFADEAELCERMPGERLRGWFSGTADIVYVRADGVLVVADWKFGPRERFTGEPGEHSCQGFFLAVAFSALLEVSASSDNEVIARFERRMVTEQGIEVDAYDITQAELDAFAEQLRGLGARIEGAAGAMPRISAACGKCKAKASCPAWDALETHAMSEMVNVSTGQVDALCRPPQSADDARTLYHAAKQGKHLTEEWERWLDAYVLTSGPVPIGLGLSLKALPQSKRAVVNTPEAMDVIERVAGKDAIVVERSATCESIKKAARDAAGEDIKSTADRNKAKAKAEADAFASLIEAGAVRESGKSYVVREVRTGEE